MPDQTLDFGSNISYNRNMYNTATGVTAPVSDFNDSEVQNLDFGTNATRLGEAGSSKYDTQISRQNVGYLEQFRGENQPGIAQLGSAINQAVVGEIIGGTLEGIGYLADVGDAIKVAKGEEVELGNWLTDVGSSLRTWSEETTPIYKTYEDGEFAPAHWSWWMNNAPSVASTLSLLIPATGVTKGLSLVGKGLKIGEELSKAGKAIGMTRNAMDIVGRGVTGLSQAVLSRHMENLMEANQSFQEVQELALQKGYSQEDAIKQASIAASDVYNNNWIMLAQDIPEYLLLGTKFGKAAEKSTLKMAKQYGEDILAPLASKTAAYTGTILSEGAEEGYQYIVQQRATESAKQRLDPDYEPRGIEDMVKDGDFWTSATFGALGAGVFQTAGRLINEKILGKDSPQKIQEQKRLLDLSSYGPRFKDARSQMTNAKTEEDYEVAKAELFSLIVGKSSEHGNLDHLVNFFELGSKGEVSEQDIENYNVDPEDLDYMRKEFPNFIEKAKAFGQSYESYTKQGFNNDIASELAQNDYMIGSLLEHKGVLQSKASEYDSKIDKAGRERFKHSDYGLRLFESTRKIKDNLRLASYLTELSKSKKISENRKVKLEQRISEIGSNLKTLVEEHKELVTSKDYTKIEKKVGKDILNSLYPEKSNVGINPDLQAQDQLHDKVKFIDYAIEDRAADKQHYIDINEGRIKGTKKTPTTPKPTVVEEEPDITSTPKPEKPKEVNPDEALKEKLQGLINKHGDKKLNDIFAGGVKSVEAMMPELEDTQDIYDITKQGDKLVATNRNTKVVIDVANYGGNSLRSSRIVLTEDFETSNELEINPEEDIDDIVDITEGPDQLDRGNNVLYHNNEPISIDEVELGWVDPRSPIMTDEDRPKSIELENYLADPRNDLKGASIEFYIDTDSEYYKKAIGPKTLSKINPEAYSDVPIFGKLIANGETITDKLFIYRPENIEKSAQLGKLRFPLNILKETNKKKRDQLKQDYISSVISNNKSIRTKIIKSIIEGKNPTAKVSGKTRGYINNVGEISKIKTALHIDPRSTVLYVGKPGGFIYNSDNKVVGHHNNEGGGIYLGTDKTANGMPTLVKLVSQKLSKQHANIIYQAFRQGVDKGWNSIYTGSDVSDNLRCKDVLQFLVRSGRTTVPTISKDSEDYKYYASKLLDFTNKDNVLYYGEEGSIDFNKPSHSQTEIEAFVNHLSENMNYPIRANLFTTEVNKIFKGNGVIEKGAEFQIGDFKITKEDIVNRLQYQGLVAQLGMIMTDVGQVVPGSISRAVNVTVKLGSLKDVTVKPKKAKVTVVGDIKPKIEIVNKSDAIIEDFFPGRLAESKSTPIKFEDIEATKRWLTKTLGNKIPINIVDDYITIVTKSGSYKAYGQVKDASISLYDKAEEGTGYHEAFHIVSLYMLSNRQRTGLYGNAKYTYPELKGKEDNEVEEFLAEKFRIHMLTEGKVTPKSNIISRVFTYLYNKIINLFVNPANRVTNMTIENIFNKIEQGYFKDSQVKPTNLTKYHGYDYLKKVEGFTTHQTRVITSNLLAKLVSVNNVMDIDSVSKMKWSPVVESLTTMVNSLKAIENPTDTDKYRTEVYKRILDNESDFKQLVEDRLLGMQIKRNEDVEDTLDYAEDNSNISDTTKYADKSPYEFNDRDNILSNVKLFIATLPSGKVDPYTNMPEMLDYHTAWSRLMKDVQGSVSFKEVVERLEKKVETTRYYDVLLNGITSKTTGNLLKQGLKQLPQSFQTQFFNAVNRYKHDFNNVVDYYNKKTKKHNYKLFEAAITDASKEIVDTWGSKLLESSKLFDADEKLIFAEPPKLIKEFYSEVHNPITEEFEDKATIEDINSYTERVSRLLGEVGISITPIQLNDICINISPKNPGDGLYKLVTDTLTGILGGKGVFNKMISGKSPANKGITAKIKFTTDSKVLKLAALTVSTDDNLLSDIALGPDNATFYIYSQPSFLTNFNKYLATDKELINKLSNIISNKDKDGNNVSYFLQQIKEGSRLSLGTYSSYRSDKINRGYLQVNDAQDFIAKMTYIMNDKFPMPTLADKKSYFVYSGMKALNVESATHKGLDYIVDENSELFKVFKGYASGELNSIKKVKADIEEAIGLEKEGTPNYRNLVQGLHYKSVNEKGIPILKDKEGKYTGNGTKFQVFVDFNNFQLTDNDKINGTTTEQKSDSMIKEAISRQIKDTILLASKLKLIKINYIKGGDISLVNIRLDSNIMETRKALFGNETKAIMSMLADYTANTMISTIETQRMFSMDPAYYKADKVTGSTIEDMIKRLAELIAPGDALRDDYEDGEFMNKHHYSTITLQDYIIDMEVVHPKMYNNLKGIFIDHLTKVLPKNTSASKIESMVKDRLSAFKETNTTDAQVFITPSFMREIKIRLGEWNFDTDQAAYDLIMSGKDFDDFTNEETIIASKLIAEPLKFVHYGTYFEGQLGIPIYDKMSLATIWPQQTRGTKLEELYNRMTDPNSPIDMCKFESAVKAGSRPGKVKYLNDQTGTFEKDNFDNVEIYNQDIKYLRRQQSTKPHDEGERSLATQIKKVVLLNLDKSGKEVYNIGDKNYTGEDVANTIDLIYSSLSDQGLEELKSQLGIEGKGRINKSKLYKVLRDNAKRSNMPYQVIDALLYEEGKPITNLDLLADRSWVESKLISIVGKKTIDLMTAGDGFIQQSNFGLMKKEESDDLQLMDDKGRTEIKLSIGFYKDVIPSYKSKSFKQRRDYLMTHQELLEGIGYRIPTQSQASAIPFIVKDVLPEVTANTVVLPLYFTALSGSDFDIDKLFLARYNYAHEGNDLVKYEFITGDDNTDIATENNTLHELYRQNYKEQLMLKETLTELVTKFSVNDVTFLPSLQDRLGYGEIKLFKEVLDPTVEEWDIKDVNKEEFDYVVSKLATNPTSEEYISKNKGKNVYTLNSKKALQNRLLDFMIGILSSKEHILHTKTPIDYDTKRLKEMSGEVRKLRGEVRSYNSLQTTAPKYQSDVKNIYNASKAGVGPFALQNVHHALAQVHGLGMIASNLDPTGIIDFSKQLDEDGRFISSWLSGAINGCVDIAKDPWIFSLNINGNTYDTVNFMWRAGWGEKAIWLLNQPVVREEDTIENYEKLARSVAIKDITDPIQRAEVSKQVTEYLQNNVNTKFVKVMNLKDNLDVSKERNWVWYADQVIIGKIYNGFEIQHENYTEVFKGIKNRAKLLAKSVKYSRVDTKNAGYGSTMLEIGNYKSKFEETYNNPELINFDRLAGGSFLGTLYNNSVELMLDSYAGLVLNSTKGLQKIANRLDNYLPQNIEEDDFAAQMDLADKRKKVLREIYSSLVGRYFKDKGGFNITPVKLHDLFIGETSVGSRLYNLSKTHPELLDNDFIRSIKPIKDNESNVWLIKPLTGDKNDKPHRDVMSDAIEEMLHDSRPEVQQLAKDLIYASFYNSGFSRRLYSYHHDNPIDFFKEIDSPELKRDLNTYIGDLIKYLNSEDITEDFIEGIKSDVLKNNMDLFGNPDEVLPAEVFTIDGNGVIFTTSSVQPIGYNSKDKPIYPRIVGLGESTAEYLGTLNNNPVYRYLPQSGYSKQGFKIKEYGFTESVFEFNKEGYIPLVRILKSTYNGKTIDYIEPSDRIIVKKYMESVQQEVKVEDTSDAQVVKPVAIRRDIWDKLDSKSQEQISNAHNAVLADRMPREEYDSIVDDLMKKCL